MLFTTPTGEFSLQFFLLLNCFTNHWDLEIVNNLRNHTILTSSSLRARYGAKVFAKDIPADQVTHVLYAFGKISKDGTV